MSPPRTYEVEVKDIGTFTFRRRRMADYVRLPQKAVEILGGTPQNEWLLAQAMMLATLEELTVAAPKGWNLEEMDPLEPGQIDQVEAVYGRLLEEEKRFRRGPEAEREPVGPQT